MRLHYHEMNLFHIILLIGGILVLIFGIVTFSGKTALGKRSYFFSGTELDKTVMGILFFLIGMLLIITFLIEVVGPHFKKEGL